MTSSHAERAVTKTPGFSPCQPGGRVRPFEGRPNPRGTSTSHACRRRAHSTSHACRRRARNVSGHDFIRAEKAANRIRALAPANPGGRGRLFEGRPNPRGTSTSQACRRRARNVSGHDFSRAEKGHQRESGLQPLRNVPAKENLSQLRLASLSRRALKGHGFSRVEPVPRAAV